MGLRVTMLGSGTSSGVPVIGCGCAVCTSADPRNTRLRPSLLLEWDGARVLVDTSTDLRQQALRHGIDRVDAVLYTHAHADHIFGFDELRIYGFRQRGAVPAYGSAETLRRLRRCFAYAFEDGQEGGGKPKVDLIELAGPLTLSGREIVPVPVLHGEMEVLGYRLGDFAYVTDCSTIPASSLELLDGVEVLILDALRYHPHPTHFTVSEAIDTAGRIGASRTVLTHLAHEVDHARPEVELPPGVELGYDGLVLEVA